MGEIGGIAEISNKFVKNRLPSEQYVSTVGVYGGEITSIDGAMVYKVGGLLNKIDVIGDKIVRTWDDHIIKNSLRMLKTHPRKFMEIVFKSEPMRHRGTPEEIAKNAQRLGLSEYYGLHPQGIEIKKPEVLTKGIAIKDIFRSDQINSPVLSDIDRFQALAEETAYVKSVHDKYGPIGDFIDDVMFQKKEGLKVKDPILNIPDVILTPSTKWEIRSDALARQQKATDVVELLVWTAFEEFRRSNDPVSVGRAMTTIIETYSDPSVLKTARVFILGGRPNLPGEDVNKGVKSFTALHNKAHLGSSKDKSGEVKAIIGDKLNLYLSKSS